MSRFKYDTMHHVFVIGEDREGNTYRLPVKEIVAADWGRNTTIVVELPFSPNHRIWEELRNE